MRDKCPACLSPKRIESWVMRFKVPDGWPLPERNAICVCLNCGLIYYDNDKTAADYDEYYRSYYGADFNLNKDQNNVRLDGVADLVKNNFPTHFKVVDFGGGDGYLERKLKSMGYTDVTTIRVGDALPDDAQLVIATQVFEHLYDLRGWLQRLKNCMIPRGTFLVEVPDCQEMIWQFGSALLDYQQVHINHFLPQVLDRLFEKIEYDKYYSEFGEMTGYFGRYYRAIYCRNVAIDTYARSKVRVRRAVDAKLNHLREIKTPVIVWGCGPLTMHLLTMVNLHIVYFVDNDPAFQDATIDGVPVYDTVTSNHPIVVMAQNQASALLKRIEDLGLKNEVIVV